nr:MAG TPA: hypothetical protein [Caudoviricetes sp.]
MENTTSPLLSVVASGQEASQSSMALMSAVWLIC